MKKNITVIALLMIGVMILPTSFGTGVTTTPETQQTEPRTLIFAVGSALEDMDPHVSWWAHDLNVFQQCLEGLFQIDIRDPTMPLVPRLAAGCGEWDDTNTIFTVPLRENVTFHDGTEFNASAVVWNFERLEYFVDEDLATHASIYEPDGENFIIESVTALDEYTVQFVLREPFAPFVGVLGFHGSYIMSPTSTPAQAEMNKSTDMLVGTGPFVYKGVDETGKEVSFERYEDYYRGVAGIYTMKFIEVEDDDTRNTGMLGGSAVRQYDIIEGARSEYYDQFRGDNSLTFMEGMTGQVWYTIGMNCERINLDFRKAIVHAFNYSYYHEVVFEGAYNPMKTPIAPGILYANTSKDIPTFDLDAARGYLIDAGLAGDLTLESDDADWIAVAEGATPIASFNSSYRTSALWDEVMNGLSSDLKRIGIKLTNYNMESTELNLRLDNPENYHMVEFFILGWGPDFNDPSNQVNPFFSNVSINVIGRTLHNDHLNDLLQEGLSTPNGDERQAIYDEIQTIIMEDEVPFIPLFATVLHTVMSSDLENFPQNPATILEFYYCDWMGSEMVDYNTTADNINCGLSTDEDFGGGDDTGGGSGGGIPGYVGIYMFGISLIAVFAIIKKQQK